LRGHSKDPLIVTLSGLTRSSSGDLNRIRKALRAVRESADEAELQLEMQLGDDTDPAQKQKHRRWGGWARTHDRQIMSPCVHHGPAWPLSCNEASIAARDRGTSPRIHHVRRQLVRRVADRPGEQPMAASKLIARCNFL
jgi:hypothetical protein